MVPFSDIMWLVFDLFELYVIFLICNKEAFDVLRLWKVSCQFFFKNVYPPPLLQVNLVLNLGHLIHTMVICGGKRKEVKNT